MINIFFDLDGTLINSQRRLYNLFIELCPECKMTYEEYWLIKRNRISQKKFLKKYFDYDEKSCVEFHKKWLEKIEEPERLKLDVVVDGIIEVLGKLSKKYNLYLVTNRQSTANTIYEIEQLKIKHFFRDVIVTNQKNSKAELIKKIIDTDHRDIFIGDTGEDIQTAKELNIQSIAVCWGILNKEILEEYKPKVLIKTIKELSKLL